MESVLPAGESSLMLPLPLGVKQGPAWELEALSRAVMKLALYPAVACSLSDKLQNSSQLSLLVHCRCTEARKRLGTWLTQEHQA